MLNTNTEELIEIYGYWGSHPEFPVDDWRSDVQNDYTRSSYWEWVSNGLVDQYESTDETFVGDCDHSKDDRIL